MTNKPFIITTNEDNFGQIAAEVFIELLQSINKQKPFVTLPTGDTPVPFYHALREAKNIPAFIYLQLDEYAGLDRDDPRLFSAWLDRDILSPLDMPPQDRITFQSDAPDHQAEIARMQKLIQDKGPLDIAVLGLGTNGHIAFNEPNGFADDDIYVAPLTDETRRANAAYWQCPINNMPTHGYTLGIPLLKQAKHSVLLVKGQSKATILKRTLNETETREVPSTYLQDQQSVTIIVDEAAASQL